VDQQAGSWAVRHLRGSAADLHGASAAVVGDGPALPPLGRSIRILEATRAAVVLGRAQPEGAVDRVRAAAAGIEVARRSSGGGAVLVGPGLAVWVDIVIPVGDPLWDDDVGRSMWWVGAAWQVALGGICLGAQTPSVWHGPLVRTAWSSLICFAGLGPGEVSVGDPPGSAVKVVGISQRRTRFGALFQCAVAIRWRPAELLDVLALDDAERGEAAVSLAGVALGLGSAADDVVDALVGHLSQSY
jgi:lipoate-protein ligase A